MSSIISSNFASELSGRILSTVDLTRLSPAARIVVNGAIEAAVAAASPSIIQQVDESGNKQISELPNITVGTNNPVDLVTSNNDGNDIKSTIDTLVQENVTGTASSQLLDNIIANIQNALPPALALTINLDSLKNNISGAVLNSVARSVDSRLVGFANDLFTRGVIAPTVIPNPASMSTEQIDKAFDTSVTNKAFTESRNFDIKSAENEEKLIVKEKGFIDPTATYPTKDYKNKSEVNMLAQGDVSNTIVQRKAKERLKGIQLPNNESWEQPDIPYNAAYPYNQVIETEAGHVIEIDNTPGAERIHVFHKSGTFYEIDASGSVVNRIKGSSYEIIDKNGYISVTGDASVSVRGSVKVFVGGDANIEVEGDVNLKSYNDITMQAAGRIDMSASEQINIRSKIVAIEADEKLDIKGDSSTSITGKDVNFRANSSFNLQAVDNLFIKASTVYNESSGSFHIKAGNNINADGSAVYLQSGKAESSKEASIASSASIGLIGSRKVQETRKIVDPVVTNYLDRQGYAAEDATNLTEVEANNKKLEQSGIASKDEINPSVVPGASSTPSPASLSAVKPSESLKTHTYLPESYQLSPHFTLGSVSSKAVVTKHAVKAQRGLTYGDIVYNLQAVCLNILEPVLALYPDMIVTSAYRDEAMSASTSQHPLGLAVDMQFTNAGKDDYYNIAKKISSILSYDQFLLEYKTYGTGMPWIHISFKSDGNNRGQVLTFLNDKTYSQGLTSLA